MAGAPAALAPAPAAPAAPASGSSAPSSSTRSSTRSSTSPPGRKPPASTSTGSPGPGFGGYLAMPSVDSAAQFLLALMAWSWVGLPFLRGGPTEVKRTLKAKFLNKAMDGTWLP